MFDLHYDLLTQIYMNKDNPNYLKAYFKKIYNKQNITGGIFNLFYMSAKEMKEELNIDKEQINLIENLKLVNELIKKYKLIPKGIKYILGIEGLDYLEKIEDINTLYNLGLRSVNIVWNNDNKFGGGAKGNEEIGLSNLGEELIEKLVEKRLAIDLSHTNVKTFYDIIDKCKTLKSKGKDPIVFASHSNSKAICNVRRNLSNNQIIQIKEMGGIIGIVSVKQFCIKEEYFIKENDKYKKAYINQIEYIKNLLGDVNNIGVSTDDMRYYKTNKEYYKYFNVFKQENINKQLRRLLLKNNYSSEEIEKILNTNFETKILQRL